MGTDISYMVMHGNNNKEKYENSIKEIVKERLPWLFEKNLIIYIVDLYNEGVKFTAAYKEPREHNKHYQEHIFTFSLTELPSCSAFLVSHDTSVGHKYQGRKLAQKLQDLKEEIAKDSGYPYLMATTASANLVENHILIKHGWKKIDESQNPRTGHLIYVWKKDIK